MFQLPAFILDYCMFILLDAPIAWSTYIFYICSVYHHASTPTIIANGCTLLLYCWLIHLPMPLAITAFGISTIAIAMARRWLEHSVLVVSSIAACSFILLNSLQGFWSGDWHALKTYTIGQICVNIILMLNICLKLYGVGKRGNRLWL